jgi:hypothetical protein
LITYSLIVPPLNQAAFGWLSTPSLRGFAWRGEWRGACKRTPALASVLSPERSTVESDPAHKN